MTSKSSDVHPITFEEMNTIYDTPGMLPYHQPVKAEADSVEPVTPQVVLETTNRRNPLLIVAWVLIGVAVLPMFLVIPMVVATGFAVAALAVAVRRGLKKTSAVIAVVVSSMLSVAGAVILGFLISLYEAPVPVNIPANYSYDVSGAIAFSVTPSGAVPCDDTGKCVMQFNYIPVYDSCTAGGNVLQEAAGNYSPVGILATAEFPATPALQKGTQDLVFYSAPNDYIIVSGPPTITCY